MKVQCYNSEPDGRLYIEQIGGGRVLIIQVDAIDAFADAIKKYLGSEGNGNAFEIDLSTGKLELI